MAALQTIHSALRLIFFVGQTIYKTLLFLRSAIPAHPGITLILVIYVGLALLYGALIPVFESPDASGHYAYIHELTEGRGLPVQGEPSGERVTGYVTPHPPLYYLLCAAFGAWVPDDTDFWGVMWVNPYHANGYPHSVANKNLLIHHDEGFPWRGTTLTAHIARLVSTVLGAVSVLATYLIALELFPNKERRWLALGSASLTAFNPMFVFTGARISNDAAVACFGGLALWGASHLAVRGLSKRGLALTGVAWGLAILSKLSGATLGPALALALLLDHMRDANLRPPDLFAAIRNGAFVRSLVRQALILFGAAACICGWWFLRNQALYGELLGVDSWLSHTETVRAEPIGFFDVIPQLEGLEISYWAIFGWFNIAVPNWIYNALWWLVRLALLGFLLLLVDQFAHRLKFYTTRLPRYQPQRLSVATLYGLLVLCTGFAFTFGSVWRFIMIVLGSQGRYLFAVIAAISLFLMLGLSRLVGRRLVPWLTIALSLGLAIFSVYALIARILPAYTQPQPVSESALPATLTRFDVHLGDTPIELIGGRIQQRSAHPGDTLTVDVYWRANQPVEEDHVAFIHFLGRGGARIGNFDGYPGGGGWPTSLWQPAQIYRDRYHIPIDHKAQAPTLLRLEAGLSGLTPTLHSGEVWPGALLLDVLPLRPKRQLAAEMAYPLDANLQKGDERITLLGADVSATHTQVRAGEQLTLTLAWRADSALHTDYNVFVHLRGETLVQADGPPLDGDYPTSFWAKGDVVIDTRVLDLPPDAPPGVYRLVVGLYHLESGERFVLPDGGSEVELPIEVQVQ